MSEEVKLESRVVDAGLPLDYTIVEENCVDIATDEVLRSKKMSIFNRLKLRYRNALRRLAQ